jgi:hypothetical protein
MISRNSIFTIATTNCKFNDGIYAIIMSNSEKGLNAQNSLTRQYAKEFQLLLQRSLPSFSTNLFFLESIRDAYKMGVPHIFLHRDYSGR